MADKVFVSRRVKYKSKPQQRIFLTHKGVISNLAYETKRGKEPHRPTLHIKFYMDSTVDFVLHFITFTPKVMGF